MTTDIASTDKEKCTCVFYEPGLVSIECDNCKRKRLERLDQQHRNGTFNYGVSGDADQQAE